MDTIVIEVGDLDVKFPYVADGVVIAGDDADIEIVQLGEVVVPEIVGYAVGPKGDPGIIFYTPEFEQARDEAMQFAANAASSEQAAKTSETNSKTSETNAKASENAAAQRLADTNSAATLAITNINTASSQALTGIDEAATQNVADMNVIKVDTIAAKNAADGSASNAATSAGTALGAQTAAETARGQAQTAKTAAETARSGSEAAQLASEQAAANADQKAQESAQSASGALASKNTAVSAQNAASDSAAAANDHAAAALASQTAAAASEAAASTSETAAAGSASGADAAKTLSVQAKTDAETARDLALQAKADALLAKSDTVVARDAALAAKTASETARDGSVIAKTAAETAQAASEAARDDAQGLVDSINTGTLDQFVRKDNNGTDFADPYQVRVSIGAHEAMVVVTQAEAEAGSSIEQRSWTAQRIAQAINAQATSVLQPALNLKAPLASPALTGTPTAPTAALATNTTQIATTAFVKIAIDDLKVGAPALYDTLAEIGTWLQNNDTELASSIATKAPLASPTFTGIVNAPKLNLGSLYGGTNYLATGNADAASYTAFNIEMRGWWGMGMSTYDGTVKGFYDFRVGKWDTKGGFFKNGVEAVYQDSGSYPINVTGQAAAAQTLRQNGINQGTMMTFNWSGQGGQPSWLWGGNDGVNMYVYNPSSFSVAYAANAGAISGVSVGNLVQFTVSSDPNEVNYPIGQILGVWNNASIRPRNEANTLRVYSGDTADWSLSSLGTGAVLAGTWRAKGVCSNDRQLFQRVA